MEMLRDVDRVAVVAVARGKAEPEEADGCGVPMGDRVALEDLESLVCPGWFAGPFPTLGQACLFAGKRG